MKIKWLNGKNLYFLLIALFFQNLLVKAADDTTKILDPNILKPYMYKR